jgi:hypothetical protein
LSAFDAFQVIVGSDPELGYSVYDFDGKAAGESLAATLCAMFEVTGNDFAVGLLVNASHEIQENGSQYRWVVTVPPPLFAIYQQQEYVYKSWDDDCSDRDDFVAQAHRMGGPLTKNIHPTDILVTPQLQSGADWRQNAKSYLQGSGVNNQGNAWLNKRPKILHDELWFRHIREQYVYEALLRHGYPLMPLPVVLPAKGYKRPNGVNRRIEPDFCLLFKGRFVVLELDGGSHWETPADAQKRLLFLQEQGAIVRRISAEDCGDVEKATLAVRDVLDSIDKEINPRSSRPRP